MISWTAHLPRVPAVCAKAPLPPGGQLLEMHLRDPTSRELSPLGTVLKLTRLSAFIHITIFWRFTGARTFHCF